MGINGFLEITVHIPTVFLTRLKMKKHSRPYTLISALSSHSHQIPYSNSISVNRSLPWTRNWCVHGSYCSCDTCSHNLTDIPAPYPFPLGCSPTLSCFSSLGFPPFWDVSTQVTSYQQVSSSPFLILFPRLRLILLFGLLPLWFSAP